MCNGRISGKFVAWNWYCAKQSAPDHNENNPSDITPNSRKCYGNKPKPKPAPRKSCKIAKPVQSPLGHIEKSLPETSPKSSEADDLPSVSIDFQTTSSTKVDYDKTNINFSDLLQDKINIKN